MKLCCSKITCPGILCKNMVTHHQYRERFGCWPHLPSGVTMAPYSSEESPGDTSQKGLLCLNFSEYRPLPSDSHPFHKMLTTSGLGAISLCRYSYAVALSTEMFPWQKPFRQYLTWVPHKRFLFLWYSFPRSLYYPKCFITLLVLLLGSFSFPPRNQRPNSV